MPGRPPGERRPPRVPRAGRPRTPARWRWLALFALGTVLTIAGATVQADAYDERRARTGARLFRSLLAADTGLEGKTGADGSLHVLVLGADRRVAGELTALIAPEGDAAAIRGMKLAVASAAAVPAGDAPAPVGVFLAQPLSEPELRRLVQWGIANRVILYSPFEGDVERGALAGLSIEAKVQPYVNEATLEATGIELKPFFLRVAKVYR